MRPEALRFGQLQAWSRIMKTSHTSEPWHMSKPYPGESGGKCVAITGVHTHYYEGVDFNTATEKADALRIVTCVNACAGMELEDVKRIPAMLAQYELLCRKVTHGCTGALCSACDNLPDGKGPVEYDSHPPLRSIQ